MSWGAAAAHPVLQSLIPKCVPGVARAEQVSPGLVRKEDEKNSEVIFKIPFLFLPVCWGGWGPQWGFASFPAPGAFPEVLFSQASLRGFCRQTHLAPGDQGVFSVAVAVCRGWAGSPLVVSVQSPRGTSEL